jgi:hypothetical protein
VKYTIANEKRTNLYFLADGIYPQWPIFMTSYLIPRTMKENAYNAALEAERKEVKEPSGFFRESSILSARVADFGPGK